MSHDWISVKDRLPEIGKPVLVHGVRYDIYGRSIFVGTLGMLGEWRSHEKFARNVTHWQPLPEKPEEI